MNRDYFRLCKPLERRTYELARKHCGHQSSWRVSVATWHHKSGSAAPVRVFRAALRPETLEEARAMAPGRDAYALQAEWQGFWDSTGRHRLTAPDKEFLGWLRGRLARGA